MVIVDENFQTNLGVVICRKVLSSFEKSSSNFLILIPTHWRFLNEKMKYGLPLEQTLLFKLLSTIYHHVRLLEDYQSN